MANTTGYDYDIAVIGAGPGGYVAAIRASQLGAKVCIVERSALGGVCLNAGCIPTKALLASTDALRKARRASEFGFEAHDITADFGAMMQRNHAIVSRLNKGVEGLLKRAKVDIIGGTASFQDRNTLNIDDGSGETRTVTAKSTIIAAGSRPVVFRSFQYDGVRVITSDEALNLTEAPRRLLIIGGGVIGCEFASIFHEVGTEVTIVEALPQLLGNAERDVARQLASYFKRRGIQVMTRTKVTAVDKQPDQIEVTLEDGTQLSFDQVLVAVGRGAAAGRLKVENAGVQTNERGEIVVDDKLRTSVDNIYAIGDIVNSPWKLAHVASKQGIVAVRNIMGEDVAMDYSAVPSVVFSYPEVASVGMSSEEAKAAGIEIKTGKFPFMALGKAVAGAETEGFVKVIADANTDRLLGVHAIGVEASNIITEAVLAVKYKMTTAELADVIHPHPTISEAIMEAADDVHGLMIHS